MQTLSGLRAAHCVAALVLGCGLAAASTTVPLADLDLKAVEQDWGSPHANQSVDGHALRIAGQGFEHGLGTHASSHLRLALDRKGERFTARVGVDDEVGKGQGSVAFKLVGDDKTLWESGVLRGGDPAKEVSVDLTAVKTLLLLVEDGGDGINYDHADWAEAQFVMTEGKPTPVAPPPETAMVLTPKSGPEPRINGARVFGARPGSPVLYTIAATGERPMSFSATGLPAGLQLDPNSGRITGTLKERGSHLVTLRAKNARGTAKQPLRIVGGDTIALTPPLGWNSWNCFACDVSAEKVRAAADAMVASGLTQHGWTYINIDDCWEAGRDAQGRIQSNAKFPDMKALADYVHGLGLKIGLYSSPGPKTCAGFTASYQHELQDAQQYAEWGFDYLKYDWCSYGEIAPNPDLPAMKKPYEVMRAALNQVPRDIVFSLCQYGMGDVWQWGTEVGGNCWRTTGDITDTWSSMAGIGFSQDGHEKYITPGHWNDPDMLVVGYVGWSANVRPTNLKPNEQYTHISLWCLLSSPLLIGCDMTKLDDFTLGLLTNDEVLAVNQDPLGRPAGRVARQGSIEIWARDLADGTKAVGLFNRSETGTTATAKWADLGLKGRQLVRDLWRQQTLGTFADAFSAPVPRHGVVLVKIGKAK